jgi:hypothetical protein
VSKEKLKNKASSNEELIWSASKNF